MCCVQVQSMLFATLRNGQSLVWTGPAGHEWGHIFFLPPGWSCFRFRTRWQVVDSTSPCSLDALKRDDNSDCGDGGGGGG